MRLPSLLLLISALFFNTKILGISARVNEIQTAKYKDTDPTKLVYEHYRLPTSVRPVKYELKVITHLEDPKDLKFNGDVRIKLQIVEDTNNITLHAQNLTINVSRIKLKRLQVSEAGDRNCIKSTARNEQHSYLIMQLCQKASKGDEYLLYIPFSGVLNDDELGYYKSSYTDRAKNQTRWLSVTQFEPISARKAFPCFDEPAYKATFTVTLGHHKQFTALSNMPLKHQRPMSDKADWIWSEFEESVPMSTYLVAYTVNDFAYKASETSLANKVQFRTWARPNAIDQCNYAADIGPKVLQFYEDTFELKFPLPKIDQIAIPDFLAEAMENWGLVTYHESALLYTAHVSSLSVKQSVATTIAHELAHQWFGNLVTMKWWTDTWLNEGFATYISTLGVNHIHPDWNYSEMQAVEDLLHVFFLDAHIASHPISRLIEDPSQIGEFLDGISYGKGSAILRMMHGFLGDATFRHGVNHYLKEHAYSNAEKDDLWNALTVSAHVFDVLPDNYAIKTIMDSWTLQTGYPLITVTRDYERGTAKITQIRYLNNANVTYRTAEQNCWWVPLTYTTKSELNFESTTPRAWLECARDNRPIEKELTDMPVANEWVIFNTKLMGVFKVQYDARNWNMLIDALKSTEFKKIDTISRTQLIDTAMDLAWSQDLDYAIALRLVEYLGHEEEYLPWYAAVRGLGSLELLMRKTTEYENFKKFIAKILKPIYIHLNGLNATNQFEKLGSDDSKDIIQQKLLIGSMACRLEVDDCVPRALSYFAEWRKNSDPDTQNPIPSNLRDIVYCIAARHGSIKDFEFLRARYENSNVAAEKTGFIAALGCSRDSEILYNFLNLTYKGDSYVQKRDSIAFFASMAANDFGERLAKQFFMENLEFLHNFYSGESTELSTLLNVLISNINSRSDYEDLKNLIDKHKNYFANEKTSTQRALEGAEIRVQWMEKSYEHFTRTLKNLLENKCEQDC